MAQQPWPIKPPESGRFSLDNVWVRPTRRDWTGKEENYLVLALPEDAVLLGYGAALQDSASVHAALREKLEAFFYGPSPVLEIGHPGVIFRLTDTRHVVPLEHPLHVIHDAAKKSYATLDPDAMADYFLNWKVGKQGETLGEIINEVAMVEMIPATWMIASDRGRAACEAALNRARLPEGGTGFLRAAQVDVYVGQYHAFVDELQTRPEPPVASRRLQTQFMKPKAAAANAPAVRG